MGLFRHPWVPFGCPWGPCWCLVGVLWALWVVALDPLGHFCGKVSKKAPTMDAQIETFSMIFLVFVESGSQRLDCACAVGFGFGPLAFTLWASLGALVFFHVFLTSCGVSLGPHFPRSEKFGGLASRGGSWKGTGCSRLGGVV